MRERYWKILNECCGSFAIQSMLNLATRCSPGRRDCARRMEFGRGIGMARWQRRLRFNPTGPDKIKCRNAWPGFTSVAAIATKNCISIDCYESGKEEAGAPAKSLELFPAFLGS